MMKTLLVMRVGILGLSFLSFYPPIHTFLNIGHRGARGHAPENTLRGFERAIALGVDMVELDVHVCASGEIVVVHDAFLPDVGFIAETSLACLKTLDVGCGQKMPTLEEVCALINRRIKINIELKGAGTARPVACLIKRLVEEHGWSYEDFFVSSFDHHRLQEFYRLLPSVAVGALLTGSPIDFAAMAQKIPTRAFVIDKDFVSQNFVNKAHDGGMSVFVFTVNDVSEIERIKRLGVEGIISDYPDRL